MSRALVTGGAGFIGSHIVDALVADGFEVAIIDDLSSGERTNLESDATLHELDIRSADAAKLVAEFQPDVFVHAAAQISVRASMEDPGFDTDVNIKGLVNLLTAFPVDRQPHFVFLSTGGAIYGEQEQFPASESHACRPTSVYGLNKYLGEQYLSFWAREHGLKSIALRLANVYGPRQNPHGEAGVVAIFCQRLIAGEPTVIFGTGEQTRDFVFVKDVAAAARIACSQKIEGIFNIGTGIETSINQIYQEVRSTLNPDQEVAYEAAKAGEQLRSVIDPSLAKQTFGWESSVTISDGLRQTAEWFRDRSTT